MGKQPGPNGSLHFKSGIHSTHGVVQLKRRMFWHGTGGSAVASDAICREVKRLRESGKPIVVSMGNIAASGGYYIAAPATKILAEPGTITGSIGVVFGKFNIGSLLRDYGIQPEVIAEGQNADSVSPYSSFSREQVPPPPPPPPPPHFAPFRPLPWPVFTCQSSTKCFSVSGDNKQTGHCTPIKAKHTPCLVPTIESINDLAGNCCFCTFSIINS